MQVYRIDKQQYAKEFPPKGSLFSEGRWNTRGMWVVYTSDSIALAKLETLANSVVPLRDRILTIIEVNDDAPLVEIKLNDLPKNWKDFPYPRVLSSMIKRLVKEKKFVGALVPSVQSSLEKNILLFPEHPRFGDFVKVKQQLKEVFDHRLNK